MVHQWDVLFEAPAKLSESISRELKEDMAISFLAIFTLSAAHPCHHIQSLLNIAQLMRFCASCSPPKLLFRDYGICDMTMYRHRTRIETHLFRRPDGTLAYYFDREYLLSIAHAAGLRPVEVDFASVLLRNRKSEAVMHRVFIHAVFELLDS
jgi:hypothetical protein